VSFYADDILVKGSWEGNSRNARNGMVSQV